MRCEYGANPINRWYDLVMKLKRRKDIVIGGARERSSSRATAPKALFGTARVSIAAIDGDVMRCPS